MKWELALAGFLLACSGGAMAAPQCPSEIDTTQQLEKPAPGWREFHSKTPHRLNQITFYDGHPDEQASLAPDTSKSMKGAEISTWQFGNRIGRRIWIACGYAGTAISLIQELHDATRSCSITYDSKVRLAGLPRITNLDCR